MAATISDTLSKDTSSLGVKYAEQLKQAQGLILDCDGVISDGKLYYSTKGAELLCFSAHDGLGLAMLKVNAFPVAIVSGRNIEIAKARHTELGITTLIGPCHQKAGAIDDISKQWNLDPKHFIYIGDDLIDIPAARKVGLSLAVKNATPGFKQEADFILSNNGGNGAIREVCDAIIEAKGLHEKTMDYFFNR